MADIQKTIEIIFGATDKNLGSTLSGIDSSIQGVAAPLGDFTKDLLATEAALAAAGAAMIGFSINAAGTFKESIGEIGALFNATSDQSAELGQDILQFASTSTQSIDDINSATFIAISTGTEWTEVTEQLGVAQSLAVAGSTDLTTATAALSRTLNAYGLEASEAERVSDALFVAAQQGDTNLTSLGSAFGKLATDASNSSVSLEDALSAVSALTVAGISTEETMTKLKQLFIALSAPSDDLAAALGETSLETNSLQEVMQKLNTVTGGSSVALRELIPNQEAVTAAMVLSKDASGAFNSTLIAMADNTGKVAAAYAELEGSFSNTNQKIINSVQVTLIGIGDSLLDEYGSIGSAIVEIFKGISTSLDEGTLQQLTDKIEAFLQDVDVALTGVAEALPEAFEQLDFSNLFKSFADLSDEFGDIFENIFGEGLDLSKPADLAEALQKAVNIITNLINTTTGIVNQFQPIFEAIGAAAELTNDASADSAKATGNLLGALTLLSEFGTAFGSILLAIGNSDVDVLRVIDVIVGGTKVLVNSLQLGFSTIGILFAEFNAGYLETLNTLTFGLSETVAESALAARGIADALADGLDLDVSELNEGLDLVTGKLSIFSSETEKTRNVTTQANEDIAASTGKWEESYVGVNAALLEINAKFKPTQNGMDETGKATNALTLSTDELTTKLNEQGLSTEEAAQLFAGLETAELSAAEVNAEFIKGIDDWKSSVTTGAESLNDGTDALTAFGKANEAVVSTVDKTGTALDKLSEREKFVAEQTQELEVQLNQIASNEKIAAMEFTADIQVAQFESQAKQIVAQLDAMAEGLTSNNELVGELFSHEAPNWDKFGFATEAAIEDANKRANGLNDSIIAMNEAQVDRLKAQTKILREGGSEITINADNLAPELQALLESLIDNIRISAVNNGLEILQ